MATEASRASQASSSTSSGAGPGLRLGGARADFVAGLGRKVVDLRRRLRARSGRTPPTCRVREELRRKMHALSSAAKMMKFDAMDRAIAEALGTIDRTAIDLPLEAVDLDSIDQIIEDLPALAWGDGDARVSRVEPVAKPAAPTYSALVSAPRSSPRRSSTSRPPEAASSTGRVTFACESTPDAQAAFDLARTTEPDLVVLDADLEYAIELVEALMDDPLTESAPDRRRRQLPRAGEVGALRRDGRRQDARRSRPRSPRSATRLRRGPRGARAPRSRASRRGMPSAAQHVQDLSLGDRARARLRGPATEVRLQGRRILVADDDPAVVWFLADLLKTAGCIVHEAFDGTAGARARLQDVRPILVISDIMMPELDGFALCRTLRRDVALRDVPVILLSWKEDLLQRVRELGAGAAGYVRKESDTRAIVARVREALRPRARIETRLRDDGEVRGRIDGVSVRTLLEIVCATRPDARVSVRDASFLYEVEIRDGAPQRATRTDGRRQLPRRHACPRGDARRRRRPLHGHDERPRPSKPQLDGNLAAQLAKPIARARAATALLTGSGTVTGQPA